MVNYMIYSKKGCLRCEKFKTLMDCAGNEYDEMILGEDFEIEWLENVLYEQYRIKHETFPHVFLNGDYIVGIDKIIDSLL